MTNDVMADLMIKFFLMGSGDAVAGSSRFISPIDHIFLSLSNDGQFFSSIRRLKSVKTSTFRCLDDIWRIILFGRLCKEYVAFKQV